MSDSSHLARSDRNVTVDMLRDVLAATEDEVKRVVACNHTRDTRRAQIIGPGHGITPIVSIKDHTPDTRFTRDISSTYPKQANMNQTHTEPMHDDTPRSDGATEKRDYKSLIKKVFTPFRLALIAVGVFAFFRPGVFVLIVLFSMLTTLGLFMLVGAQRIWFGIHKYITRISKRDPERGARMRARMDKVANRWDGILDMFPEEMVENLYMPDFANWEAEQRKHQEAVNKRLERMD